MGERGSSVASCSVPLMVTDMGRRKPVDSPVFTCYALLPAASKSELIQSHIDLSAIAPFPTPIPLPQIRRAS